MHTILAFRKFGFGMADPGNARNKNHSHACNPGNHLRVMPSPTGHLMTAQTQDPAALLNCPHYTGLGGNRFDKGPLSKSEMYAHLLLNRGRLSPQVFVSALHFLSAQISQFQSQVYDAWHNVE
jgi:hypothetical protein